MGDRYALIPAHAAGPLADAPSLSRRLLDAFLAGRNTLTLRAYSQDLEDFRSFVHGSSHEAATTLLLSRGHGAANELALSYRTTLVERHLSPATVNRRLAALRSLVKLARTLGFVSWALEVENLKSVSYRDTRGPGRLGFRRLLEEVEKKKTTRKAVRDRALLRLLHDLGLRRGEVVSLNLEDFAPDTGMLAVTGKGRTQKEYLTLPEPTKAALSAWLETRGPVPGPLFTNFDRARKGTRLTGTSLYRIVRTLGRQAGLKVRPHGLRHSAITEALDLTNGNARAVQKFSRHRGLRVLTVYDDNRRDLAGEVARLIADTEMQEDGRGLRGS